MKAGLSGWICFLEEHTLTGSQYVVSPLSLINFLSAFPCLSWADQTHSLGTLAISLALSECWCDLP